MPAYWYSSKDELEKEFIKVLIEVEKGTSFDQILTKLPVTNRIYKIHLQAEEQRRKERERNRERAAKAAQKKAIEDAKRLEAVQKLTPEERAAFGLDEKGYHTKGATP